MLNHCWKWNLRGCNVNYGKCLNYIVWLIGLINREKWRFEMEKLRLEMYGVKGCCWIIYHSPNWNVDWISICAFIFCLEINALGYRWRIVVIVVDNAWWLGKLKLIVWMCHWVWRWIEYIKFMYWLIVYRTLVFICIVCRGGDGGCTPRFRGRWGMYL
mgnify:CR=1 FL=1